ncbi:hypothetical protein D3C85_482150 [compost metagenome]
MLIALNVTKQPDNVLVRTYSAQSSVMEIFEKGERRLVTDTYHLDDLIPRLIAVLDSVYAAHGDDSSITVHVRHETGWAMAHQTIVAIILSHVGKHVDHTHPVPVRLT